MAPDDGASPNRALLLRALAGVAGLALIVAALGLAGVFSDEDDEPRPVRTTGVSAPPIATTEAPEPRVETIRVGGRPSAIAAGEGGVWVADAFSPRAAVIRAGDGAGVTSFTLPGPSGAVAAGEGGAWYGLYEQQAVERRDPNDAAQPAETIDLDAFPAAIATGDGAVWALIENGAERIDPAAGEVTDHVSAEGFATALAVDGQSLWIVADNRELRVIDTETLESEDDAVELPDATRVAAAEGYAWVLSATGRLTRVDAGELDVAAAVARVRGAVDLSLGEGALWVVSSDGRVTRLDPGTGARIGEPLRAGADPTAISAGEGAVWVANAGDGTVTRIEP